MLGLRPVAGTHREGGVDRAQERVAVAARCCDSERFDPVVHQPLDRRRRRLAGDRVIDDAGERVEVGPRALLDAGLPEQPADDARDSGMVPYATVPGTLAPAPPPRGVPPPALTATAAATVPYTTPTPSIEPSAWSEPSTSTELPASSPLPAWSEPPTFPEPPSPATVGARRNPAATLLIGVAVVAVIATVALFVWLQQRGPASINASNAASAIVTPAPASFAAASPPTPIASAPTRTTAADAPTALVERTPVDAPPAGEAKIDHPPDAAPGPATAVPVERATIDGDAASSAATASPRPARPRRESPAPARADNAAVPKPAAPRVPSVSAQCSDILQKASLEPLTATEAAYLKRECR